MHACLYLTWDGRIPCSTKGKSCRGTMGEGELRKLDSNVLKARDQMKNSYYSERPKYI